MGDATRQTSDCFQLLGLAELCFQLQTLGDVEPVTVDYLIGWQRIERPGQRPVADAHFKAAVSPSGRQALSGDGDHVGRQDRKGFGVLGGRDQFLCDLIQVDELALCRQFHDGFRIQARYVR